MSLITVRNMEDGKCFGFFRDYESVLKAVAGAGLSNWVAEERHPTLTEMSEVFDRERRRSGRADAQLARYPAAPLQFVYSEDLHT